MKALTVSDIMALNPSSTVTATALCCSIDDIVSARRRGDHE